MKKKSTLHVLGALTVGVLTLAGCGGGGGGGSTPTPTPIPTPTPVTVKFRTYSSTITNFGIYSGIRTVGFRLDLPVGIAVATDPLNAKQTAIGALKLSGVLSTTFKNLTSLAYPRPFYAGYSSAKPAGSGKNVLWVNLLFNTATEVAFDKGEFMTLNCTAAPGTSTALNGFILSEKLIEGNLIGIPPNTNSNDLTTKYKLGIF